MSNHPDPVVRPEVVAHEARASYFRRAAESEVREAVKHPHGSMMRAIHEGQASEFYAKVASSEAAVQQLCQWFTEVPDFVPTLKSSWMEDVERFLQEAAAEEEAERQIEAFAMALASFTVPEPLIILSVSESGHIVCPEGECVGWVK